MKHLLYLLIACILVLSCTEKKNSELKQKSSSSLITPFEKGNKNQTATYEETIDFYKELASNFATITIDEIGITDSGKPLHLITYSKNTVNWSIPNENKIKILINNGIHPGESDGIDASMMLLRDLANGNIEAPDNLIFSVIAIYNIGGALNRNSSSRTNQNGPEEYGFRGNARNYDLNRDFIKADTRNARAFYEVFHKINPDLFIDNHVSNGADYQYVLTHLFTQHNKLGLTAGKYLHEQLQPALEQALQKRSLPITPYVNVHSSAPEAGFSQFMDSPRYSTGYTTLWNTMGMMVETHMLKPYKDRVMGTKAIMEEMIKIGSSNIKEIKNARLESFKGIQKAGLYALNYEVDDTKADTLNFMGYEPEENISELTGNKILTYNRSKPFTKKVAYNNYFKPQDTIVIPEYYVVPASYWNIIELFTLNRIKMEPLLKAKYMKAGTYRIKDFTPSTRPYEGHFPHREVVIKEEISEIRFRESDILVPTNQPGIRYIIETLEPLAADSFFKWNYFDTILQQKEGFSSYVFEATAVKILNDNPTLKKEFDSLKKADSNFRTSNEAQLDWIHKRSNNYETAHMTYPIRKIYYEK